MRTDEKLEEIVDRLQYNCGDVHEAARYLGLSPAFVFQWIKDDQVAADRIREAQRVGYAGLESEAIRRAVVGIQKDVYYKGEVVGQQTEYSDGLLGKVMEARLVDYKKGEAGMGFNNSNVQINIMPRAENYEQWLSMRDATTAVMAQNALPAPTPVPDVLQGDFIEYVATPDRPLAELAGLL
jgi:DNA-binding transcriptional regulator YdaS (Cro superfamily)